MMKGKLRRRGPSQGTPKSIGREIRGSRHAEQIPQVPEVVSYDRLI